MMFFKDKSKDKSSRPIARRLVIVLAAFALAASSLISSATPAKAQGPACAAPYSTYSVQSGDDLFRIGLSVGVIWPILQQINGLPNPNLIFVGQLLCLPTGGTPVVVPTVTPGPTPTPGPTTTPYTLPPYGVFPYITLSTVSAGPGDTITITGANFPSNVTVNIYLTTIGNYYPTVSAGTAQISATGTLSTQFTIPAGTTGSPVSVLVKDPITGYFGYNFFYNTKP